MEGNRRQPEGKFDGFCCAGWKEIMARLYTERNNPAKRGEMNDTGEKRIAAAQGQAGSEGVSGWEEAWVQQCGPAWQRTGAVAGGCASVCWVCW